MISSSVLARAEFYKQYPTFCANIEQLEYALYDIMKMDKSKIEEIHYTTNVLWKVFCKVSKQFPKLSVEQLLALGIRKEMLPYISLDYLPQQSVLARFDFICTANGDIKAIELNGDTPFLITETFEMNEHLCAEFGLRNPNRKKELFASLSKALFAAVQYVNKPITEPIKKIVITGKTADKDIEEFMHVEFIRKNLPFEVEYVPIEQLIIFEHTAGTVEKGLYTPNMEKIDILYRPAHPIEFLIDDVSDDEEKTRIGLVLLELVKSRALAIINSPSAYILQSKILLWLIWEQRANPLLFTKEERQAIEKYMLPTYLHAEPFQKAGYDYVKKPVYSREGNTVELYNYDGSLKGKSQFQHYTDNLYIYQQYVEMPEIQIHLNDGAHTKKWLLGSFVANGQACGLACRVGNAITEWDSHWLAIGYD